MAKNLLATLIVFLVGLGVAEATPVTWSLQNALFDDGAEANGSFAYDVGTNTYSNWLISVFDGTLSAFAYDTINSQVASTFHGPQHVGFIQNIGLRYVNFTFTAPLTNAGGTIPLDLTSPPLLTAGSYECDNCLTVRVFTAGSVTTTPAAPPNVVPEPSSSTLLIIGLGMVLIRFPLRFLTEAAQRTCRLVF